MRSIRLPTDMSDEAVSSTYRDGVLCVMIAKKTEEEHHRKKIRVD